MMLLSETKVGVGMKSYLGSSIPLSNVK